MERGPWQHRRNRMESIGCDSWFDLPPPWQGPCTSQTSNCGCRDCTECVIHNWRSDEITLWCGLADVWSLFQLLTELADLQLVLFSQAIMRVGGLYSRKVKTVAGGAGERLSRRVDMTSVFSYLSGGLGGMPAGQDSMRPNLQQIKCLRWLKLLIDEIDDHNYVLLFIMVWDFLGSNTCGVDAQDDGLETWYLVFLWMHGIATSIAHW